MKPTLAAAAFAFLAATAISSADLPKYWSVHIDTPRAEDRTEYEQIGRQQALIRGQIATEHGFPRLPVLSISTSDGMYLSLRPRASMSQFDARSPYPDEVEAEMQEKAAPLDDRIHSTLRAHHNEIWQSDSDLTYLPADHVRTRRYGRLMTTEINPAVFSDYTALMRRVRDAVAKTNPNIVLLTFFSRYGDGGYRHLWLSDDVIPPLRNILVAAYGRAEADALMKRWRKDVVFLHGADARPRPDLTGTDIAKWLQY